MAETMSNGRVERHAACNGMLRNLAKVMLYAAGGIKTVEKVI
jgi:hypothetical protein